MGERQGASRRFGASGTGGYRLAAHYFGKCSVYWFIKYDLVPPIIVAEQHGESRAVHLTFF